MYVCKYICTYVRIYIYINKGKVKWSRYRPGVAQRVGRGIALLFHDRGTRRGWVVSNTPRPHFTPGKDPVPILQEAGWVLGPLWTGGKSRPHRDSILDLRPVASRYTDWATRPTHTHTHTHTHIYIYIYIFVQNEAQNKTRVRQYQPATYPSRLTRKLKMKQLAFLSL